MLVQGQREAFVTDRLRAELVSRGWPDGSFEFEERIANDQLDQLAALASDLVMARPNLIVVHGDSPAVRAAMSATRDVPIFFLWVGDPVRLGLVQSLARPGGNVTGLSFLGLELERKRLELLKLAVPGLRRLAVITNGGVPDVSSTYQLLRSDAEAAGIELVSFDVRTADDLSPALELIAKSRAHGLHVQEDFLLDRLVEQADSALRAFAIRWRLPMSAPSMSDGVLVAYAFHWGAHLRQAGRLIDRLLRGALPRDLPVEQPTRFDTVISLRTARELGLEVPPALLLRADRVVR